MKNRPKDDQPARSSGRAQNRPKMDAKTDENPPQIVSGALRCVPGALRTPVRAQDIRSFGVGALRRAQRSGFAGPSAV